MDFREEEVFSRSHNVKRIFLSLLAALAVAIWSSDASASVQFDLNHAYNFADSPSAQSPAPPSGTQDPWLQVLISDKTDVGHAFLSPNQVEIKISGFLTGTDYLTQLAMNFTGNVANLHIIPPVQVGVGAYIPFIPSDFHNGGSIDSSTPYSFHIDFPNGGTSLLRFDGSDQMTLILTNTGAISATQFAVPTTNLNPYTNSPESLYAAAEIDGIDPSNPRSVAYIAADSYVLRGPDGEIITPEPASLAIWSFGLGIAGLVRLRRKK
jgi:hypothetical protein